MKTKNKHRNPLTIVAKRKKAGKLTDKRQRRMKEKKSKIISDEMDN